MPCVLNASSTEKLQHCPWLLLAHHIVCSLGLPTEGSGRSVTLFASVFLFCSSSAKAKLSVTSCTPVS